MKGEPSRQCRVSAHRHQSPDHAPIVLPATVDPVGSTVIGAAPALPVKLAGIASIAKTGRSEGHSFLVAITDSFVGSVGPPTRGNVHRFLREDLGRPAGR
jgi:hypothetical protein